jgi:carbonic anhydrase/acetyltransferase-like protein (isoleucine patch superfamily)
MSIRLIHGVFLADTARVLGEVELAPDVSIWYGVSIRGDVAKVTIGQGTNVQDNAVIHCDSNVPNTIGRDVTIGHGAIVHGVSVGDGTLIGMGATVLGGTRIGRRCLVAAGAVVPPNMQVPDDTMVVGVPARIARPTNEKERMYLAWLAPHYVKLARLHAEQRDDPRVRPWEQRI